MLVVPEEGELELLRKMLKETADTEQYLLRVYKNNYTPEDDTTLTDFTEADFTNYVAITLSRTNWATPSINGSGAAQSSTSLQSWTCGATGNTVYGYYVVGATSGKVLWAEKFGTARVLALNDILNIQPVFTINSEN